MSGKGSKKGKIKFLVAVHGSKTSVLKLPIILGPKHYLNNNDDDDGDYDDDNDDNNNLI